MPLQLGALRDALLSAGADPQKAERAAEELAGYDNRFASLETRIAPFEARVEARFSRQDWMIGVIIALQLAVLSLLFRALGH